MFICRKLQLKCESHVPITSNYISNYSDKVAVLKEVTNFLESNVTVLYDILLSGKPLFVFAYFSLSLVIYGLLFIG